MKDLHWTAIPTNCCRHSKTWVCWDGITLREDSRGHQMGHMYMYMYSRTCSWDWGPCAWREREEDWRRECRYIVRREGISSQSRLGVCIERGDGARDSKDLEWLSDCQVDTRALLDMPFSQQLCWLHFNHNEQPNNSFATFFQVPRLLAS